MSTTTDKPPTMRAQIHALAPVIQRWSELCKQQAKLEPTPAIRWYLQGRADAHHLDAARLREALSPTVTRFPPTQGVAFTTAYETLLQMMSALSPPTPEAPPEPR